MSYQVLARKWRPRNFAEMVGQEHVLQALINALDNDRLHHAYLFTGTRGVGKTTIARILAKSLNCEQGVGSQPCGKCSSCCELDQGRFIDMIEVDAASRTKVEDTRDLLDNVQYAPTRGRYKVYLIDEVHMLSTHSFNALLKTLEEPPPHVKFLLATTDPQKLPVTVLSRCLQFNLKRLSIELITQHLQYVLNEEHVQFDEAAVTLIAKSADGSMRDALSLMDQAISYNSGRLLEQQTRAMLGSIDRDYVVTLVRALVAREPSAILDAIAQVAEHNPDFDTLLAELLSLFHQIAVYQMLNQNRARNEDADDIIKAISAEISAEDLQLYYQIALNGRRDLPLAPDQRTGLEMIMLRMITFRPVMPEPRNNNRPQVSEPPRVSKPQTTTAVNTIQTIPTGELILAEPGAQQTNKWSEIVSRLKLNGLAKQLAANCIVKKHSDKKLHLLLALSHGSMLSPGIEQRLNAALAAYYGYDVNLLIEMDEGETLRDETPAQELKREEKDRLKQAEHDIDQDDNVKALKETFNAQVVPNSVQPRDNK